MVKNYKRNFIKGLSFYKSLNRAEKILTWLMGSKQKPTEKASIYDSLRRQSDFDLEKTSLLESRMQAATAMLDGKFHSMLDTVEEFKIDRPKMLKTTQSVTDCDRAARNWFWESRSLKEPMVKSVDEKIVVRLLSAYRNLAASITSVVSSKQMMKTLRWTWPDLGLFLPSLRCVGSALLPLLMKKANEN